MKSMVGQWITVPSMRMTHSVPVVSQSNRISSPLWLVKVLQNRKSRLRQRMLPTQVLGLGPTAWVLAVKTLSPRSAQHLASRWHLFCMEGMLQRLWNLLTLGEAWGRAEVRLLGPPGFPPLFLPLPGPHLRQL